MVVKRCREAGCPKSVMARGMCSEHWFVWRRAVGDDFVPRYGDSVALFWEKVDRRGEDECWPWLVALDTTGYGAFQGTYEGARFTKAHRFAYRICVGPVPRGLMVDHKCHTRDESCVAGNDCPHRRCVNPAHLEPCTRREVWLRSRAASAEKTLKTHCAEGHPLSGDNLVIRSDGARRCKVCKGISDRRSYHARKA
jgi:hypothetical protein